MKKIYDEELKREFINKSSFCDYFSFPAEEYAQLVLFEPLEQIIVAGEVPTDLYFMLTGQVKLTVELPNGKTALVDFFTSPSFIGEMELIDKNHDPRSVQTLTPCYCLALPIDSCSAFLLNDPVFLRKLAVYLGEKNSRNINLFTKNQSFPLANRLASFILFTQSGGVYREVHTQVSEYLGVSYRHLLYVLADFVDRGFLGKASEGYRIIDEGALSRLAGEMDP